MATYDAEKARYEPFFGEVSGHGHSGGTIVELANTPLFTVKVRRAVDGDTDDTTIEGTEDLAEAANRVVRQNAALPQYALLGHHVGENEEIGDVEPIFLNTCAPNSFFICGLQGSGKSYTLAALLEDCLLPDIRLGQVADAVAGVAFHYDVDDTASLAEVASLCSRGIKVHVLVSISNLDKLSAAYMSLRGAKEHLTIEPLLFQDTDLTIERIHKLMAFLTSDNGSPLYMEKMNQILRDMAIRKEVFTLARFKAHLDNAGFKEAQTSMLNIRLSLLESFIAQAALPQYRHTRDLLKVTPGKLTIIDLSDSFIDAETVCVLFDVCLGMIKQKKPRDGMVIVLDEAHKYLRDSTAAATFTEKLLTTIREQRHNGTRVILATQEPTISPRLLDLCSTSIIHKFTSPAWFSAINEHLGGASSLIITTEQQAEMLNNIINLCTGEALLFSPASFVCLSEDGYKKLGSGHMRMRTRMREGVDSGKTHLVGGSRATEVA